jgi:hypothetical protein
MSATKQFPCRSSNKNSGSQTTNPHHKPKQKQKAPQTRSLASQNYETKNCTTPTRNQQTFSTPPLEPIKKTAKAQHETPKTQLTPTIGGEQNKNNLAGSTKHYHLKPKAAQKLEIFARAGR